MGEETPLQKAMRHVGEGEVRLGRQRSMLAQLQTKHRPTGMAERLIASFEDTLRLHQADLVRLQADHEPRPQSQTEDATMTEIAALRALLLARPRPTSVAERRERLDALGLAYRPAEDIRLDPVSADGVPAEWSNSPGADPARVLLYLHGGGFSAGSIISHRAMVTEAGRAARARTLAIDYRRTPEHPFPAALEDALSAYRWLLVQGMRPERIAIGGDSAGGGLALAMMISLRDNGEPLPACGWCISPWVDMEARGESYATNAAIDPMISKEYILELAGWYLGGTPPHTPLAAPLYGDLRGLPPLLIQVGSAETLFDDSIQIAARAGAMDVRVTLDVWPQMIHAWPLFHQQLTGGRRALAAAGSFMVTATG